ncbi:MAG: DUF4838 domain-containing protein [Verrucomicrobiota bacterium]
MKLLAAFLALLLSLGTLADVKIASKGKPSMRIVIAENAPAPTQFAAEQLSGTLATIVGAKFEVTQDAAAGQPAIFVGSSAVEKQVFGKDSLSSLASEEILIRTTDGNLLLAGGGERGDLYAVSRFLQEQCNVRWWTPWASRIPKNPNLAVGDVDIRYRPPFELREPFWMPAFDPLWAARNTCNGQSVHIPPEMGGCVQYKGFVHTFYPLVPPEKYFNDHPEWYSLIGGNRTHDHAQLCLTNPKLREFVVQRVKEWLRESPQAKIVSVSQNDWYGACECENCKALDTREGSHSGTMLDFVNYVAQQIEPDFPDVSVDTLAYQYTRKPPKTLRPRKNVIVRLCSIECNFREPLDHASNAAFADDIKGWAAITDRLYVWDYTTDFAHYVQPHPNWFTLGPNVRFFANHHVRGLFEQGAYQSHGSEMSELRAWVLAQLLWNPAQDDRALIREFLEGYYGTASEPIYAYFELMHEASKAHNLTCYSATDAPFLNYEHLAPAEQLWAKAEEAVKDSPEFHERVRTARLTLRYVWLSRWDALRKQAENSKIEWPLADSRSRVAEEWREVAQGQQGKDWTRVTRLNEGGLKPDEFLKQFSK